MLSSSLLNPFSVIHNRSFSSSHTLRWFPECFLTHAYACICCVNPWERRQFLVPPLDGTVWPTSAAISAECHFFLWMNIKILKLHTNKKMKTLLLKCEPIKRSDKETREMISWWSEYQISWSFGLFVPLTAERERWRAARVEAEALQQAGLLQPVSQHADRTGEAGTLLLMWVTHSPLRLRHVRRSVQTDTRRRTGEASAACPRASVLHVMGLICNL